VSETALEVQTREGAGKGVARKLRAAGRIPATLYGRGADPLSLALDPRALERILRSSGSGLNTLLDIRVQGREDLGETVALVKELQRHPVRGTLLHADLFRIDLTKTVEVEVPVHLTGKPHGVELGGVLDHMLREVTLECLPRSIPDVIEIDVSGLDIGDGIHVRDLPLPEDVRLVTDAGLGVAQVVAPAVEEVAPEAELEEAAAEEAAPAEAEASSPSESGAGA
jgi:large subunit ribosomal protein L25